MSKVFKCQPFLFDFNVSKRPPDLSESLVKKLMTGLGPVTSSLPMRCATTCATSAYILLSINLWFLKNLSKADDGTRTRDLLITNEVRYHLCHISLFAGLYFARHALLYYFPNVLSTPFLSFFIFIKKDINLALRLYKELNCVKIHVICSCYFNSQSVFLRSLTCRK